MKLGSRLLQELRQGVQEATVERDKYYYDQAEKFYTRMLEELEDSNFSIQENGNLLFKGSEVSPSYSDLSNI